MPLPSASPSRQLRLLFAALVGLAFGLPSAARDWGKPLFEWRDDQGVVRYTSHPQHVPVPHRGSLREVRLRGRTPDARPLGALGSGAGGTGDAAAARTTGAASDLPPGDAVGGLPATPDKLTRRELSALDREIEILEAKIARDQEILKTLISDPEAIPLLAGSPDVAELARRLPEQQDDLRELQERRAQQQEGAQP